MLCFLYVMAVTACLGLVAKLLERSLPPAAPRRWIWCATIVLSIAVPAIYQAQHAAIVATSSAADAGANWWLRIGYFDPVLLRLWPLASLLLIGWAIGSALRVGYVIRRARAHRNLTAVDGIQTSITDTIGPAAVGVWKSTVVIPRWVLALPAAQRRYIMLHEDEHRRAHDTRLLFFASIALIMAPWNLPLWWHLRRLYLAIELDCDHRVVAALGDAPSYGETLLGIAEAMSRTPRLQPGFLGGAGSLERRLAALMVPDSSTQLQRYLSATLALVLLLIVLGVPHPVTTAQSATQPAATSGSHQ